jgi:hypothetical protein
VRDQVGSTLRRIAIPRRIAGRTIIAPFVLIAAAAAIAAPAASAYEATITSGYNGKCLDADLNTIAANGTKVQLWHCNGSLQQEWYVDQNANGLATIRSAYSGRCVDAAVTAPPTNGTPAALWDCNATNHQQWILRGESIYNAADMQALDADLNTINADGTKVQVWSFNGLQQQQWNPVAQSGNLTASPASLTVPQAGGTATTMVTWTAPGDANVWESVNGAAPQLLASGTSGSEQVSVPVGQTTFSLSWGTDATETLATAVVNAAVPPPSSPLAPGGSCSPQPSASGVVLAATFAGGKPHAKETVRHGRNAAIAGTLTDAAGGPVAGAPVCIVARTRATGSAPYVAGSVQTDSVGGFTAVLPAGPSRRIELVSRSPLGVGVASLLLAVRPHVTLRAGRTHLRNHQALVMHGALSRPVPSLGAVVLLQVRRGGRWQTFEATRSSAKGRFAARYRFEHTSSRATYRMRAEVPQQSSYGYATGWSRAIAVRVAP